MTKGRSHLFSTLGGVLAQSGYPQYKVDQVFVPVYNHAGQPQLPREAGLYLTLPSELFYDKAPVTVGMVPFYEVRKGRDTAIFVNSQRMHLIVLFDYQKYMFSTTRSHIKIGKDHCAARGTLARPHALYALKRHD